MFNSCGTKCNFFDIDYFIVVNASIFSSLFFKYEKMYKCCIYIYIYIYIYIILILLDVLINDSILSFVNTLLI